VGRTDLGTGSDAELFATLQRLKTLPPETLLFPGHHYAPPCISSLEIEMRTNGAFTCKSVEELAALP
jgi:glyoxylase-like metal-dependent hydrolase (beta-lactamase superfamily II)